MAKQCSIIYLASGEVACTILLDQKRGALESRVSVPSALMWAHRQQAPLVHVIVKLRLPKLLTKGPVHRLPNVLILNGCVQLSNEAGDVNGYRVSLL